jgi:hypothetical protein
MLNLSEQNSPTPRCIPILSNNSDSLETPHSSLRTNQESRISPATPRHCIYPTLFVSNGPSTELQPSNVVNDISHGGGGRLLDAALFIPSFFPHPQATLTHPTISNLKTTPQNQTMGKLLSEAIGADHDEFDVLYENIKNATDDAAKVRWRNQLTWTVARHAISEELTWYPAMEKHLGEEGTRLAKTDKEQHQGVRFRSYIPVSVSCWAKLTRWGIGQRLPLQSTGHDARGSSIHAFARHTNGPVTPPHRARKRRRHASPRGPAIPRRKRAISRQLRTHKENRTYKESPWRTDELLLGIVDGIDGGACG